jgi:hypothetical protein
MSFIQGCFGKETRTSISDKSPKHSLTATAQGAVKSVSVHLADILEFLQETGLEARRFRSLIA